MRREITSLPKPIRLTAQVTRLNKF